MIVPSVWTRGQITVIESIDLSGADTWQLIDPDTSVVVDSGGVDSADVDRATFTPGTPPPGVYTVVIRNDTPAELVRYTGSLAVLPTVTPTVPPGISLQWVDALGAVQFTAGGMTSRQTVRIIGPGNVLIPIRGYESADWHEGVAAGYGYAFEMPLGVGVRFGIADVSAKTWLGIYEETVFTPSGRAWLRDLHDPLLSLEVVISSTDDELRPARQTVHKIAARPRPIVRWDVREGRQGTVVLRVENAEAPFMVWEHSNRDRLEALLETGRPLLLTMCHSRGFPPCYMAVTDYAYRRLGLRPRWALTLNYFEVDNPTTVDLLIPNVVTWGQAQEVPANATWADWAAVTWLDIATRTSI